MRVCQTEVRCHAVLCKSELVAQTIASRLQDRLSVALDEFVREKRRSQNSRLSARLHRQSSLPNDVVFSCSPGGGSVRTKFLKLGQNFRPSIGHSNSAPKLGSITEGDEDELAAADSGPAAVDGVDCAVKSKWLTGSDHQQDDDDDDDDDDSAFCSSSLLTYVITAYIQAGPKTREHNLYCGCITATLAHFR